MSLRVAVASRAGGYPVHIVPTLSALGACAAERMTPGPAIVSGPPPVLDAWGSAAVDSLCAAGFAPTVLPHADGEASKCVEGWSALVNAALAAGLRRETPIFALGGGVTGDLVGFAAAAAHRGVPLVQVPTSLLAMVDSSVGGKVAINTPYGKNLIGAFYPPRMVVAAVACLQTLPAHHRASGMGEVLKHAALQGGDALDRLIEVAPLLRAGHSEAWTRLIAEQVRFKAGVVARDEHEQGERLWLNLGHTIGHAIEAALDGARAHGLCVADGLRAEALWAAAEMHGAPWLPQRLAQAASALDLPSDSLKIDADTLFRYMRYDKKRGHATLQLPMVGADGRPALVGLDDGKLLRLAQYAARTLAQPAIF